MTVQPIHHLHELMHKTRKMREVRRDRRPLYFFLNQPKTLMDITAGHLKSFVFGDGYALFFGIKERVELLKSSGKFISYQTG
jgi:hypothetical protein